MRIMCSVEIRNRTLPTLGLCLNPPKSSRCSLSIGKGPDKEFYLVLQKFGDSMKKYKIKNNIPHVFVRFVDEGKATIRLLEPEHDLALKCDPILLKGFLKTLKSCLVGGPCEFPVSTFNFNQRKSFKLPKTKLKIQRKEDYPILEGFPRTLENLVINNANQTHLDSRILRLRNLTLLNLENNSLKSLPEMLGSSLPNLAELHLSNNCLGHGNNWKWVVNSNLQKKLKLLDLRSNELTYLHQRVVMLYGLVTLMLDSNELTCLPEALGFMRNLRYFSASKNHLTHLPGSAFMLKLDTIDCSKNPFERVSNPLRYSDFYNVKSLVDIASSCVIKKRLKYCENTLPMTVIDHLQTASFCLCGKPCFSGQPFSYIQYRNHHGTSTVIASYSCEMSVAVRYCSFKCYSMLVT